VRSESPWWKKVDPDATDVRRIADPTIDSLDVEGRAIVAAVWQNRGASELKVGGGFAAVTSELIEHGTADVVLKLVSRAVRDEVRHAEIAVDMAARYGDREVQWPHAEPFPVPRLEGATGKLRATLLVIALCCINETVACAILEGQIAETTSPLTRAGLQSVLTDEIDHARAGWAHLATPFVTAAMKEEIGARWLPRLLDARLRPLVAETSPFPGEQFPAHGILPRAERQRIAQSVLLDVVCPGFARAGIDATAALAWTREVFPG
jgi:hypothetical protein